MTKVDEARLKGIEVAMAWNGSPSDATVWARSLTQSDVTDLSGALREAWVRVTELTEALQLALPIVEKYEPCGYYCDISVGHVDHRVTDVVRAALAATAGTEGERAGRVQKLEALAKVARVIDKQPDFFSPGWRALHHALADLDAEAKE